MPIIFQMENCQIGMGKLPGTDMTLFVIADPASGIQVHAPLTQENLDELAKIMQAPSVEVATAMPSTPPPRPQG